MDSDYSTVKQTNSTTRTSDHLNMRINKKLFVNIFLVFLVALAGLQTWQLVSLQGKIAEVKSLKTTIAPAESQASANQQAQPANNSGGVNSLPTQVGGC